jgi:hypothetical protein
MGFGNFEKAALLGAAAAGLATGEQSEVNKPESTIERPKNEQVALSPRLKKEIQKDADGREYLMIDGAKAYLSPEPVVLRVETPIIESKSMASPVLEQMDGGDKNIQVAKNE